MSAIAEGFAALQGWLFQTVILPALYALGLMDLAEPAFDATEYVLFGVVQIVLVYGLLRPLEAWRRQFVCVGRERRRPRSVQSPTGPRSLRRASGDVHGLDLRCGSQRIRFSGPQLRCVARPSF